MSAPIYRKVTNYKAALISFGVAACGIVGVGVGLALPNDYARQFVTEISGAVFGIGGIGFLWEVFSKREFRDETLAIVGTSASLEEAGVDAVLVRYLEAEWKQLLAEAEKLDILFAYGATWRSVYGAELKQLVTRKGIRVRVVLPDPGCPRCVAELAQRFDYTTDKVAEKIREGIAAFQSLQSECKKGTSVEIRLTPIQPLLTFYLFGNRAVCATYRHKPGRGHVPTYIVRKGGTMYAFVEDEFEFVWDHAKPLPAPALAPPPATGTGT